MLGRLLCFLFVVGVLSGSAHAERRVALLIGNGAYANAPLLDNPRNDVALLQATLQAASFEVIEPHVDLNVADMSRAIHKFESIAAGADVALFYYSGHGLEVNGTNFLVPIDAKLEGEWDVRRQAIDLDEIIAAMKGASKLRLILLDACRTTRSRKRSSERGE